MSRPSDWSTPCLIDSIPTPPAPPVGITSAETAELTLYPNPASMMVTVETDQPSTLTLTDATYFVRLSTSPMPHVSPSSTTSKTTG